jgi:DNA-binding LacI/PurR family transcriptional regulator
LREEMANGQLCPGDRMLSRAEMQARFGISRATVDKVHSVLEQEGLIVKEQGRGTFVASAERHTVTRIIGCAGVATFHRHLSYYLRLMQGMQEVMHREGYELLILNPGSHSIAWEKIDAVLSCTDFEEVKKSLPPKMPIVNLLLDTPDASTVIADDYRGVRLAVEHLLRLGHRRIGYLLEDDALTEERLRGYHDAMDAAGIKSPASWVRRLISYHEAEEFKGRGRESMRLWLDGNWSSLGLTALLAQNDRAAVGMLEALQSAGIRVPQELSLMGFDSTDECELTTPRLTSVAVPLAEIGAKGAELLLEEMAGAAASRQTVVLPTQLVVRESTAPPRV